MTKETYIPLFKKRYLEEIRDKLISEFDYKNPMQVPKLEKIVLNMCVGAAVADRKKLQFAIDDMKVISGQAPVITRAKVSVSSFKLREGMPIGCKVTLRGTRMYEFLERLVNIALPRVRDFRGLNSKSFDGRGNYALGLKEQTVFPEVNYDKIDTIRGMDIVICTNSETDDEARALLRAFDLVMN